MTDLRPSPPISTPISTPQPIVLLSFFLLGWR
jgi:hypothetical protein